MTPATTSRRIRTAESTNQPTTGHLPVLSAGGAGGARGLDEQSAVPERFSWYDAGPY